MWAIFRNLKAEVEGITITFLIERNPGENFAYQTYCGKVCALFL